MLLKGKRNLDLGKMELNKMNQQLMNQLIQMKLQGLIIQATICKVITDWLQELSTSIRSFGMSE